jgi:hypothetical protein
VTRTVMSATTNINAPTTIITVPCVVDDLVMDTLCHGIGVDARDERHLRPPISAHMHPRRIKHIAGYGRLVSEFSIRRRVGHA